MLQVIRNLGEGAAYLVDDTVGHDDALNLFLAIDTLCDGGLVFLVVIHEMNNRFYALRVYGHLI